MRPPSGSRRRMQMTTASEDTRLQPLVDNHRAFLRFLERRVGSREDAEDILQDAFGRSLDKLDRLGDDESIVRWFYRVLRNAVIDHYRRKAAAGRARDAFASEFQRCLRPRSNTRSVAAFEPWPQR